ncbi:L-aspartate/glutamate-specific racemase [Flavobacterium bizetiae]|uniref:L-aspartate/glutamate-specific racemase n=1 Tax=Flavobacterium bizetiae TaxID=2704140 RepID=A0A6J4GXN6_9FLAO|nr:aspartate/glutamate racemase family protein [Flavobacterium bizetiae]CAA9202764.1 L-aspartate/glutamate-specific racemase [Flavobacterium bizetiae]CAD5344404.1 L-aspartate/glutamate-specific racemase [Flavobacterium bizetiae]CAD5350372.1 L-aspartate/glutamate-specific racemase [Flavobacterium bizetiae]
MKIIGLIGGISWVSTGDYYKLINQGINDKLGGLNFSECLIYSFNYADIKKNNENNDWDSTFNLLLKGCQFLKQGGAEAIVLCANTMHFIADRLEAAIDLPIIHIATATAIEIEKQELKKVGLLGTKFTMELDFFKDKLLNKGIEVIIPKSEEDKDFIHTTIFEELGKGIVSSETKKRYLEIANQLIKEGAEGIILGCTEIPLVIKPEDLAVPIFDTALIHSNAAVDFQLS